MQLKKINTESKTYKNIRGGISWFSGLGAGFTLEAMSIPWVKSVVNSKLMRLSCFGGIVTMSTLVMEIGRNYSAEVVDAFADVWNGGVDFVNGIRAKHDDDDELNPEFKVETKKQFIGLDIPGRNATPKQEKEFIDGIVSETCPFEFSTEKEAKEAIENLVKYIENSNADSVDICSYFASVFGRKLPDEVYDICLRYGWTKDDIKNWGVDRIADDLYIIDLNNYHDISSSYEIL